MDIFMMEVLPDGLEGVLGLLSAFFTAAKAAAATFTMLGLPGSTCGIFVKRKRPDSLDGQIQGEASDQRGRTI